MDPQADEEPIKKSSADASAGPAASNGCFDCNICLDFAADPVVTLCGHLYCWPCIYKWLQQVESSAAAAPQPQCPVCKAGLSEETLVPLYGRGHSSKKRHQKDVLSIPSRPSVHRESVEYHTPRAEDTPSPPLPPLPQQQYYEHTPYYGGGAGFDYLSPSSPMGTRVIQSTAGGVLGGMAVAVLPWVLGSQVPAAGMYHPNPYYVAGNGGSPRRRRQEMEVARSLHQIWFFLFVFAVLCLLLF
ncbi:E3 ubiquitin-protein ligase RMA1H1-like [Ananas comosus]|uniref:E3 ubiquitin-protein ligase RMA n=1 Tax=Ananas comosus TaxID=4615 RepID=A0A6P5EM98_ANACO|nr:E3 ubiquitin-protein ligase RMA1H1-like [Ananas comosus]XP_020084730.1 E3 ubiquitin-protein ligase RMA1H1-like [Ananas comosus]XP_020084731.1 E3 ubiquitin-protein ligase RMA1H1-like [Ananas comosus]XP_020084732.1 E3 ubiquitin-protein ligase RMA1H1-like [Ananas comosus]XP_020084733.1 E3 ubiquitin-protein ligase RMA1H1-like [Ananas comosus]